MWIWAAGGGVDLAVGWWPRRAWPGRGGSLERAPLRAASISQMVIPGIHFDRSLEVHI